MEPLAWKVLSGFDGEGLAAFLTLTGSVAFVVVGIPTMMVGWGRGVVGRLARFSAMLHGVLLVLGPTLLLLPLHGIHPSATFLVGILYAAMLMIRMLTERGSDQDRLMRVASPWLFGVVAELASWLLGGAPAWGLTLVGVALEVSLVSYVSFWIAFPFFFFAGKASGEQLELFTRRPALYALGIIIIAAAVLLGLWSSLHAWQAAQAPLSMFGLGWVPTLIAIGMQVYNEVRMQRRQYATFAGGGDPEATEEAAKPAPLTTPSGRRKAGRLKSKR